MDIGFEVVERRDGTYRVRTEGMGRRGRPEIEVTSVGAGQVEAATQLLRRVIESTTQSPLYAGQTIHLSEQLAIHLEEAEHLPAASFARALGATDRTIMRVLVGGTEYFST